MPIRPHLKLNTQQQSDPVIALHFNYGFGAEETPDAEFVAASMRTQAQQFVQQLGNFNRAKISRVQRRSIEVPAHITNIYITFHGQFNIPKYFNHWYNDFGLVAVSFTHYNSEVLFSVWNEDRFAGFLRDLDNFIERELNGEEGAIYDGKVRYIKNFSLLTSEDIIQVPQDNSHMHILELMEFPLPGANETAIERSLITYLNEQNVRFRIVEEANIIQIENTTQEQRQLLVDNFDIIKNVTSTLATVIRPNHLNLPQRGYGFEVIPPDENAPIIGILDTGIENTTPLRSLLINDDSYNLTASHSFSDTSNGGSGHGTAVAALASLGRRPYLEGYRGQINADARLLSMKILDNNSGNISQPDVIQLIRRAHQQHGVRIFVLTVCYDVNKKNNEDFSTYAYELDKVAHELGCLLFICTSNNDNAQVNNIGYDLTYFSHEDVNLSVPAESMNNVTVGAAADCLRGGIFIGASPQKEFPTMYSRKGHIDLSVYSRKKNQHYFKPDVLECGGDYEVAGGFMGTGGNADLEVLSADPTESFYTNVGTSFSAPLAANIAAQILRKYPSLAAQTVKALIINGASLEQIKFNGHEGMLNRMAGHGPVNPQRSLLSDDDNITFIIEDTIRPNEFKSYPIRFPRYLFSGGHSRSRGLVTVRATLCFSFKPVLNNQLSYNPLHIAFSFFRNHDGNDIQEVNRITNSKLTSTMTWSQNGRNISNPIPYSNTQKVEFPVNLNQLNDENGIFKLAVHCRVTHQMLETIRRQYDHAHNFSIVITVENNLKGQRFEGRLYDEMVAINNLDNIVINTAEGEAEV
jgi:hypothetical protein